LFSDRVRGRAEGNGGEFAKEEEKKSQRLIVLLVVHFFHQEILVLRAGVQQEFLL